MPVAARTTPTPPATIDQYAKEVIADLNKNNFTGAWDVAEYSSNLYGTPTNDAPTQDPLVAAMESSQGLQQLDPTKQWTAQETQNYYAALGNSPGYHGAGSIGKNPYGLWGNVGDVTGGSDASANLSQEGVTPDVERFAGARPSQSFASKWGPDILALAAAVAAPEAIGALGGEIGAATGAGALASDVGAGAIYGAGTGAILGEVSGGNVGKDALFGALGGAVTGGIEGSGLTGLSKAGAEVGGKELTSLAGSTLTSPTGKGASAGGGSTGGGLSPGLMPVAAGAAMAAPAMSTALTGTDLGTPGASPSFGNQVLGGLEGTMGQSSLGGTIGSLLPYLGVGAIGELQANAGQRKDAGYANTLMNLAAPNLAQAGKLTNAYNTNTLNPTDAAGLKTGTTLGQNIIAAGTPLEAIATTAFSNYNSGTLRPTDQAALDANTASAIAAVQQQFANSGTPDSTMLDSQIASIKNQAEIAKGQILDSYFTTGNQAYDTWLQSTTQGSQIIQAAQQFASTQMQNYLTMAMNESTIGLTTATAAINTQMATDQQYADQVSQLMGNLAQGYARQAAASAMKGGNPSAPSGVAPTAQDPFLSSTATNADTASGGLTDTSLGTIPSDIVDPSLLSSSGGDLANTVGDLGSILG